MHRRASIVLIVGILLGWPSAARADDVDDQLAVIAHTGPQASGSREARAAADALSSRGTDVLPRLLVAMDTDNPVAANWYRAAYETIVERELAADRPDFPRGPLQTIVDDRDRRGRVRRLALALSDRLDPGYRQTVVRGMLDDPEFREDAVDMALTAGEQALTDGDSETARDEFQRAFEHARQPNQVTTVAAQLAKLGQRVDIAKHLGLVVDWWVVGPFDAPWFSGFARKYPPESQVDLQADYVGPDGGSIAWRRHHTDDPLGLVNLVQALAPATEAVGYAYVELDSPRERDAQLRVGADDNVTVWLNARKVFAREQWLNGSRFDRFAAPVKLMRGTNRVLVKICQGPQHVDPQVSNNWTFQLRFCDKQGRGISLRARSPKPAGESP